MDGEVGGQLLESHAPIGKAHDILGRQGFEELVAELAVELVVKALLVGKQEGQVEDLERWLEHLNFGVGTARSSSAPACTISTICTPVPRVWLGKTAPECRRDCLFR
jgi:hypothetical protein